VPLQGNDLQVPCQILPGGKFSDLLGRTWHATNGYFSNTGRNGALENIFLYFCNQPEAGLYG